MKLVEVTDPEILAQFEGTTAQPKGLSKVEDPSVISSVLGKPGEPLAQPQAPKEQTSTLGAMGEVLGSIGSSMVAEPIAGLAGLFEAGLSDVGTANKVIEDVRENLTYTPESEQGQQMLQSFGETLAPVAEFLSGIPRILGDKTLQHSSSPELATIAHTLPTALLEVMGFKGLRVAKKLTPGNLRETRETIVALSDPVKKFDASLAEVKLGPRGDLVPDKVGEALVKNSFPETTTAVVTNATQESKQIMGKMFDAFTKGQTNDVYAISEKALDQLGLSVTKRLNFLKGKKADLSRQLDSIAENNLKGVSINIQAPLGDMASQIAKDFGVKLRIDGTGKLKLGSIENTPLSNPGFSSTRKNLENLIELVNMKTTRGSIDGMDAHKTKRLLDEFIEGSKASEAGLTGNTTRLISSLRKNINDSLRLESEAYASVNDKLSTLIQTEAPFKRYVKQGKSVDDPKVSDIVSAAMKNLGGDASSSKALKTDILRLDDTMKQMSAPFKDEPLALLAFKEGLEKFYRLEDDVLDKAIRNAGKSQSSAIRDAMASGSVGNLYGVTHDLRKLTDAGFSKSDAKRIVTERAKVTKQLKQYLK